ncbi:hypothetical protein Tco_0861608 [Tanacetum coccineum]|uniref:Uncharacterized protein n=1 Tax=Tanacetum coccineum TaxID=301880 RepID=A0ABQ5BLK4_9ASTR
MEYLAKISKKARILELKQRHLKITVLTSNTPYPSRKIRRIYAYTSQKTTKETRSIRHILGRPICRTQAMDTIFWKISNVVPTPRNSRYAVQRIENEAKTVIFRSRVQAECTRYCAGDAWTNRMMTRGTAVAINDWVRGSRRSNHGHLCPVIGNDWLMIDFVGSKKSLVAMIK